MANNLDPKRQQLPPTEMGEIDARTLNKTAQERLKSFSDLLDTISSLEEKKKALWKHIYENALTDRNNAYLCFADLYKNVHNNPGNHALHGQTLSKYLERMSKATDQLLKLAELLTNVEEKAKAEENLTDAEIYSQIGSGKFQ